MEWLRFPENKPPYGKPVFAYFPDHSENGQEHDIS